jgi:hypothetical protein
LLGGTIQPEFAFNTLAQATLASQALLDQVFVDGESGAFDSDPALTYGCDFPFSCLTFVPYEVYSQFGDTRVNAAVSVNYYVNFATDFVTQLQRGRFDSDEANPGIIAVNFAVFKPAATVVPEPNSFALLSFAFVGMAAIRRRKR